MKRILIVDDERPVIDGIAHIIRRDLNADFELAGTASSGREAIETAITLAPDIVLMDIRMPGISGLEAIREIRKRGASPAFIVVTAYERFDIAREAVELGVAGYLLKPVTKDKLANSLNEASTRLDRRKELDRKAIGNREREERVRDFAESALLHGIVLGERVTSDMEQYRTTLGIDSDLGLLAAVAILPHQGSLVPEEDASSLHEKFRTTVRYKTKAIAGPLFSNYATVLIPLRSEEDAEDSVSAFKDIIQTSFPQEMAKGLLSFGFGTARKFSELGQSWTEAMASLLGNSVFASRTASSGFDSLFEEDDAFLGALFDANPERASIELEKILSSFKYGTVAPTEKFRVMGLFSNAYRVLFQRGMLAKDTTLAMMDLQDLAAIDDIPTFSLVARMRMSRLASSMGRSPRWSQTVGEAIAYIKEHFAEQTTLETVADLTGISPGRLSRLFIQETGRGFSEYLIEFRIEKAKELLMRPGLSIKHVSVSCGYADPNYFARLFKKMTGHTPSSFASGAREEDDAIH